MRWAADGSLPVALWVMVLQIDAGAKVESFNAVGCTPLFYASQVCGGNNHIPAHAHTGTDTHGHTHADIHIQTITAPGSSLLDA